MNSRGTDVEVTLQATGLRWLAGDADAGEDQCAHGLVRLDVGDLVLVGPEDEEVTVSAAGLFLLRTLDADHLPGDLLTGGNQLFPCCGHLVIDDGSGGCFISGCPMGVDMSVVTEGESVTLRRDTTIATTTRAQWREAVLGFARQIDAFYSRSVPRALPDDESDAAGWRRFWKEWRSRVDAAGG
ncbi:hypothetical protein GCM10009651_28300 [Microbacterium natoriense]|nr:hypothetical protein CQ047_10945 [Microbacterium sp. MYb72]